MVDDPVADTPPSAYATGPVDYDDALQAAREYAKNPELWNPPSPAQVATILAALNPPQFFFREES